MNGKATHRGTYRGFGLKMLPKDLLKFGQLFLQQGMWDGQSLISSDLVSRSTKPAIPVTPPNHGSYAWHWWVDAYTNETSEAQVAEQPAPILHYYYARGFGGQFVYIVPALELVAVLTNDKRKKEKPPLDVFPKRIAPELLKCL